MTSPQPTNQKPVFYPPATVINPPGTVIDHPGT